jgi:hypothetical protein
MIKGMKRIKTDMQGWMLIKGHCGDNMWGCTVIAFPSCSTQDKKEGTEGA